MSTPLEMHTRISKKIGDKLTKFCTPLVDHLNISHFFHYGLTHTGHFASIGLHQEWHECLFSSIELSIASLPYFYSNKEQLQGITFMQTIPNNTWENMSQVASSDFGVNLGLMISSPVPWGMEGFGFGLKTCDPHQHMALLRELPLLQVFIQEYRKEVLKNTMKENSIDVLSLLGPSLFQKPKQVATNLRQLVLGKMKIKYEIPFTNREQEIIRFLLDGYITAQEIADEIYLSKRTIEHHIERIKNKLDCTSKSNLIQELRKISHFLDI